MIYHSRSIHSLVCLIVMMALSLSASAQKYFATGPDTVNASENLLIYVGGTSAADCEYFPQGGDFSFAIKADSLSGATNTLVIIQGAYAHTPDIWVPLDTLTVNGPLSNIMLYQASGGGIAARYRYQCLGSGTQATKVIGEAFYRKARY